MTEKKYTPEQLKMQMKCKKDWQPYRKRKNDHRYE